jgi:putative endonuclease
VLRVRLLSDAQLRPMAWYVYILESKDNSLYTGITVDIERRVSEHNSKKGSKSLKGKLPVRLVYNEVFENRSQASRREAEIKSWERSRKLNLIKGR